MGWWRLSHANVNRLEEQRKTKQIFVARRADGKMCVGHISFYDERSVTVKNGDYEVTLWFSEPRAFTFLKTPDLPEPVILDRKLNFG